MQLFKCQSCAQLLHFDNDRCVNCGHQLGYVAAEATLFALEQDGDLWRPVNRTDTYRLCLNAQNHACNWLVSSNATHEFCEACQYNRTIPDLSLGDNLENWRKVERAKHHLFYSLLRLNLPMASRLDDPTHGLAFDFKADPLEAHQGPKVMTGHEDGVITINLAEADDGLREQRRVSMGEPYRTLLGHFRHEIGHYFWDRLIAGTDRLQECRGWFGDETADYEQALKNHYANGPLPNWEQNFVSAYATAHPWEDFAETWAHYLHIVDTLEMAGAYGLRLNPVLDETLAVANADRIDPYREGTIDDLMAIWLPITVAVNSLNRCIGQPDFYPFVLSPAVVAKLGFIHDVVRSCAFREEQPLEAIAS